MGKAPPATFLSCLLRREKDGNLGRERKKARAMSETGEQKRKRLKAARAIGLAKAAKARRAYRDSKLGTFGAAGPCKRIDPKTGEVIEVITRRGTS
jgi:hypothetical protein